MISPVLFVVLALFLFVKPVYSAQSTVSEVEGHACMGDDKSSKQTEDSALEDAKKKAIDIASTYIRTVTEAKNFALEKDLLSVYTQAEVTLLQEPPKERYKDPNSGDCLKMKIKADVIPYIAIMQKIAAQSPVVADEYAIEKSVKTPQVQIEKPVLKEKGLKELVGNWVCKSPCSGLYDYNAHYRAEMRGEELWFIYVIDKPYWDWRVGDERAWYIVYKIEGNKLVGKPADPHPPSGSTAMTINENFNEWEFRYSPYDSKLPVVRMLFVRQ